MEGTQDKPSAFDVSLLIGSVLEICTQCNGLIEVTAPWRLAKDPLQAKKLDSVLYHLVESLRIVALLLSPILPQGAHGIFDQLNWKMEPELRGREERFSLDDTTWGKLPDGHVVGQPKPLFPRIEANTTMSRLGFRGE